MCLAIPGKIVSIDDSGALRMGQVSFSGASREVCLAYEPDAVVGDYVLVHVGFAISTVDESEALRVLGYLQEIGELE